MGAELLQEISEHSGLPNNLIENELLELINKSGYTSENITLDDLRLVLAEYLQDTFVDLKDSLES